MHIAFMGTRGVPARYGGFETAAEEIGRRLAARGHQISVYCRNPGQDIRHYLGMDLVNLPAVRVQAAETLSHTMASTGHAIWRRRPDVAIVFNAANAPFLPALQRSGIPAAIHVDGLEWQRAKWGRFASAYYRWAERQSTRWSSAVIADSYGIVEYLLNEHGVLAEYIPYGAPRADPDISRLREVDVDPRQYHLVVARFVPENSVTQIVAGYSQSSCALPLVVVGDSAYGDAYRNAVLAAAGEDRRIRFLGGVWDQGLLDALYAGCATYLHGHTVGGTNPSLLRAMGAGAPVIARGVPFNWEVAQGHGRYFTDAASLTEALEAAEREPLDTLARAARGQEDVLQRYQWDQVADDYEKLAARLVGDGQQRSRRRPRQPAGSRRG